MLSLTSKNTQLSILMKAVFYKRWYTYSELDTLVDGAAASLIELGAKKDSGIALIYTPSIDALVLILLL